MRGPHDSRSAFALASLRSISRQWCRCGCIRWPSPAVTRSLLEQGLPSPTFPLPFQTPNQLATIREALPGFCSEKNFFLSSCDSYGCFNMQEFVEFLNRETPEMVIFTFKPSLMQAKLAKHHTHVTVVGNSVTDVHIKSKLLADDLGLGGFFWIQEGRVPFSYMFSFTLLALTLFAISDLIYIPYLFTFFILLFVAPGVDFFIDNLQDYRSRLGAFLIFLLLLTVTFSSLDLSYRVGAHEKEDFYYSYNIRESSISTGLWVNENFYSEIIESNDQKRPRRVVAYTDSINLADAAELSSNQIALSEMELKRYSIFDLYWYGQDHLWEWENASNQTNFDVNLSLVNLGMSNFSGKSSTSSITASSYYKSMPDYNFKMYYSKELALYWTNNY